MDCNKEQSYSDNEAKEFNGTLPVYLENKVKELHTNVRHITQSAMTWFAFFVTTNYLSLGWFAKDAVSETGIINPFMACIVAVVFIVQNVLGIVGIGIVIKTIRANAAQVSTYENWLLTNKNSPEEIHTESQIEVLKCPSIPTTLYETVMRFLQIVLGSLIIAWISIMAWIFICYLKS